MSSSRKAHSWEKGRRDFSGLIHRYPSVIRGMSHLVLSLLLVLCWFEPLERSPELGERSQPGPLHPAPGPLGHLSQRVQSILCCVNGMTVASLEM